MSHECSPLKCTLMINLNKPKKRRKNNIAWFSCVATIIADMENHVCCKQILVLDVIIAKLTQDCTVTLQEHPQNTHIH